MLVHFCVFWFCLLLVFFLQILLFLMFGWGRYGRVILVVEVFERERQVVAISLSNTWMVDALRCCSGG